MKSTGHYNLEREPRMCIVLIYGKGKTTNLCERMEYRIINSKIVDNLCEKRRLDLCLTLHSNYSQIKIPCVKTNL